MIESLAVASDQVGLEPESPLGRENSIGVKLAQNNIESRQVGHARLCGIHRSQHGRSYRLRVRIFSVAEQFEARTKTFAHANDGDIDAVRRGSAHNACD